MNKQEIAASIDITEFVCPMTFVQVKVALADIAPGQVLAIRLNAGEPIQNVPRSLRNEGHKVIDVECQDDGTYHILVTKGG